MKESVLETNLKTNIQKVWEVVTDNKNYAWRSDIEKIEIIDDTHFREYYNEKNNTLFTITEKTPYQRYAFYMENANFIGEWEGIFRETKQGGTCIIFTEKLEMKNPVMRVIAKIAMPLKKMQLTYEKDLKKELGEEN